MQPDFPNVVFHKIDVDENEEISMDLEVSTIPHFIFFKDGAEVRSEQLEHWKIQIGAHRFSAL